MSSILSPVGSPFILKYPLANHHDVTRDLASCSHSCSIKNARLFKDFCTRKQGSMLYRRWFVCLSVTTITKKIVDRFASNFMGRFLGGKERPSSCFVTIGRGMWK